MLSDAKMGRKLMSFMTVGILLLSVFAGVGISQEDDDLDSIAPAMLRDENDGTEENYESVLEPTGSDMTEKTWGKGHDSWIDENGSQQFLTDDHFGYPRPNMDLNDEDEVSEGLETTFIGITDLRADTHSIYLNERNAIHVTVQNIGGDAGDAAYAENITAAIDEIEDMIDEYSGHPRVGLLEKAVERLEDTLLLVSEHQREESIKSVRQAVVHLNAAGQGRQGIPTEDVILWLGEVVRLKVDTVIDEAGRNFGSEHPDVQEADAIYEDGVDKLEDGKYIPALNRFRMAFKIVLGAYVADVNIDAYSWMPDGYEEDIWSGEIEQLEAESYEVLTFNWHPTKRGIHYLRFNMTGEYEVYRSPPGTEESPFRMMSFGVSVIPMADEYEYWEGGKTIDDEVEFPSEGYDSTEILMWDGDLTIKEGGALIFRDNVTFIIENPEAGDYGIHIKQGGRFEIDSPLRTTEINADASNGWESYFFHNHGEVHFEGPTIMRTYGPEDIAHPGGIQNFAGSTAVLDNTTVIEADTHSVYIGEDSNIHVMGEDSVIGRHDQGETERLQGHGIIVEGVAPRIEDVAIQWHKEDGIHVRDSRPGPIPAASLHEYASGDYDQQLTRDGRTSTQPIVDAGNGNLYMVYLDEDDQHINFMRSSDQGRTWSEPIIVPDSAIEEGHLGNISFSADGDNLAVAWEVWTEAISDEPDLSPALVLQYSSNGGEGWAREPYTIGLSCYPSVEVEGNTIYVGYMYRPWPPYPIVGSVRLRWTDSGWENEYEHDFEIEEGVPEIAVVGDTIHTVIASEGNISYIRSDDGGESWTETEIIAEYAGEMPYGYVSMDAVEDRVYLVWSMDGDYNDFQLPYRVYGMYANYEEGEWEWSDEILISSESTGNSVHPDVTSDNDGNWYVVWEDDEPYDSRIRYSVLDKEGEVVVTDMCLTPDTHEAILPSITIDGEGYAYVVWSDGREYITEIFIKQQRIRITNTLIGTFRYVTQNGITLQNSQGSIISHNHLQKCRYAIQLHSSNSNIMENNKILEFSYGIFLQDGSKDNTLRNNNISDIGSRVAISIDESVNNVLINNTMVRSGIFILGEELSHWNTHEIETCNTVNDKPVYYWANKTGGTVPAGAGQIILANSTDVTVERQEISWGCIGITLGFSNRNTIDSNVLSDNADGIGLFRSHGNTISNNIVWMNSYRGIFLYQSDRNLFEDNIQGVSLLPGIYVIQSNDNNLSNNTAHGNAFYGIVLLESTSNDIINNTATSNSLGTGSGIRLYGSNDNTVTKNWAAYNGWGIRLTLSHDNHIVNNNASDNHFTHSGIFLEGSDRNTIVGNIANSNNLAGIRLWYSNDNIISENTASYHKINFSGIYLQYSDHNMITNNTANSNRLAGISLHDSTGNHVSHNIVTSNRKNGIFVTDSYRNKIDNNLANSNSENGIHLFDTDDCIVSYNTVSNNTYGIIMEGSDINTVSNNDVIYNGRYGVRVVSSNDNTIYHNNFMFNGVQAIDDGSNQWDAGHPAEDGLGGNYWSDYEEKYPGAEPLPPPYDWIWDTPYEIAGDDNEDRYPLREPVGDLLKFEIPLTAHEESDGWNFVSIPIEPLDPTVPTVLSSIEGTYDTVLSFQSARDEILHVTEEDSAEWKSYVPDRPDHYNTLKVLNNTHGFWIRMTEDANLTVYGYAPEVGTTTLVLEPGWNMVGYPSVSEGDHDLPEEVDIIGYFDKYEEYNVAYDHEPADFVFVPGQGYWIHNPTEANIVWTVEFTLDG